jgi:hypothetical protein
MANVDAQLERSEATRAYVPLRQTIGRLEWDGRVHHLRRWVERMGAVAPSSDSPRPVSVSLVASSEVVAGNDPILEDGEEALIVAPQVGVRGRVDCLRVPTRGPIEIVDFKSGELTDEEGGLKADATLQVRLYALAVEELTGGRPMKLELAGSQRFSVAWGARQREETARFVGSLFSETPRGGLANAADIARPGVHCRLCRVRPVCGTYLEAAPRLWTGTTGIRMPLDVWGRIEEQKAEGVGLKAWLRDPSDRLVVISGVDPRRGLQDLAPGARVYFFNLEATEDPRAKGRRSHPRNFHELPSDGGRRRRRAAELQVFFLPEGVKRRALGSGKNGMNRERENR